MMYGFYDVVENIWYGNGSQPLLSEDKAGMEKHAPVLAERLSLPPERVQVREFAEKNLRKRDEVTCDKTVDEASDVVWLRELSAKTGIAEKRLQKIIDGRVIQSKVEDDAIRKAFAEMQS